MLLGLWVQSWSETWVTMGNTNAHFLYSIGSGVCQQQSNQNDQSDRAQVLFPSIIMKFWIWNGEIIFWSDWRADIFLVPCPSGLRIKRGLPFSGKHSQSAPDWQPSLGNKWPSELENLKRCFVKPSSLNWHRLPSYSPLSLLGLSFETDVS